MKEELVRNYSVSPLKVRRAGLEEVQSLMSEAQTRNIQYNNNSRSEQ